MCFAEYYTRTDTNMFQEKYIQTSDSENTIVFYSMEYYTLNTCQAYCLVQFFGSKRGGEWDH